MLAVTYVSLSSKSQEDGFSLMSQDRTTTQYAACKKFDIVRDFTDPESAEKQSRNNFNVMLAFLRDHRDVRVVVAASFDRLIRNIQDFVEIEDLVEELDIEIHLVKEGQIIRKSAKTQDRLVQQVFARLCSLAAGSQQEL
jgi:DNA invertase Pin-like site-specific DNA recombinase